MLIGFAIVLAAIAVAYLAGPRVPVDTTPVFDPASIGDDPDDYLARREMDVPDIRADHGKEIVWADGATRSRTEYAIVYIHGFSASKHELRPVPDRVAQAVGANLYFTRLTGHGQNGAAMADASVNDWINDFAEAMAIGRLIGRRVIVMATSTGGSLATWAATRPELAQGLAGLVLVSPNYELQAAGSTLLTGPWGRQIAELATGRERGFEPFNALHARYWTTRYPTAALLPMAAMTKLAREAPVEEIEIPALFIFSDRDGIVSPARTRAIAARWAGPATVVSIDTSGDPFNHVIVGDAVSPQTNEEVVDAIVAWIGELRQ
ncbi:MAG: lysophospholipase [Rhizobiaceae bacterium]|nr:lysophospholipase [Rhizobiaceae bacterium]MCV0406390.1 lysophospholipase [Rhizobiaceae bacterium]